MKRETGAADLKQLTSALAESADINWYDAAVVCAQIESEFPGRTREIMEQAAKMADDARKLGGYRLKDDILVALVTVIERRQVNILRSN